MPIRATSIAVHSDNAFFGFPARQSLKIFHLPANPCASSPLPAATTSSPQGSDFPFPARLFSPAPRPPASVPALQVPPVASRVFHGASASGDCPVPLRHPPRERS